MFNLGIRVLLIFLIIAIVLILLWLRSWTDPGSDFALAQYRERWLQHPVIGAPSWDTFQREPGNPIFQGSGNLLWPVNGFLFRDPPSQKWYAYVGLYPRGYWPPEGALVLRENAGHWENAGLAVQGSAELFDGKNGVPGGAPDVSVVRDSVYHLIYDWCNPDNSRGGIAYARALRPEGPFERADRPIHEDTFQMPLLGIYVRGYAATLVRRRSDWLILFMMSTPKNAGGTWALAGMTASQPEGIYSAPTLLLFPQSEIFHPSLLEFYPVFVHEDFVYAPATSVAANRAFQTIFRAKIEDAHLPAAWQIFQHGSVWHDEPVPAEAMGIWGQTFSGQVSPDGILRVLFPSKTATDIGTINIARRRWDEPYRDGFVLSAPNAPAAAVLRDFFDDFDLRTRISATGPWVLAFGCQNPLGPDQPFAGTKIHPLMRTGRHEIQFHDTTFVIIRDGKMLRQGRLPMNKKPETQVIVRSVSGQVEVSYNSTRLFSEKLDVAPGRIELLAETGTILKVNQFIVTGKPLPAEEWWLGTEARAGAPDLQRAWQPAADTCFRFGNGFLTGITGARAKWNYVGQGFQLWAPRRADFGTAQLHVDGTLIRELDFHAIQPVKSGIIFEMDLPPGQHAVLLEVIRPNVPLDVLKIFP